MTRQDRKADMDVSVVAPIYNELENIPRLYEQLSAVLERIGREYEIILVDDGSTDGSSAELSRLAAKDERVKIVEFRRNYGQTEAMAAGIQVAEGELIVTIDGDLQNDPADIPTLIDKIEDGYDLVHGWRKDRQDAFWTRCLPSKMANWLISRVTGFPIHDLGCTLKIMRRDIAQELELHGEMHRFIPILAYQRGARCAEIVTRHHHRRFGVSKYGLGRTIRVLLDLITVKYLIDYLPSPMKLFGLPGLMCVALSLASGIATVAMKAFSGVDMTGNPLLLLSVGAVMLGGQFLVLGMLGELCARIYYSVSQQQPFAVRRTINVRSKRAHDPESRQPDYVQRRAA